MISREKMPTAVTADNYPIHNWFNFVAGYAPEYVLSVIEDYKTNNGDYPIKVYDPFAGCATTCVVANNMKIPSLGVERNPFFYKIGYTKTHAKEALQFLDEIVIEFRNEIKNNIKTISITLEAPVKTYLEKLYEAETLKELLLLREAVKHYDGIKYYMGFTFLSKIMEYTTTAKTDGIYKVPTSKKKALSIDDAIDKTYDVFKGAKNSSSFDVGDIVFDSSINYELERNTIDLVIFSPPYLNNFDFAEMTRLQLYFWEEANSWGEISEKHRNKMLINTTTALKDVKSEELQNDMKNTLPTTLIKKIEPIVEELKVIKKENSKKKEYYKIIYPYLAQMKSVLENCYVGLRKNGEVHIVVSDAAFYGIHVDTQEYLCDILENIGFTDVKYIKMRDRGDRWILDKRKSSGKQLGEYEVIGRKDA